MESKEHGTDGKTGTAQKREHAKESAQGLAAAPENPEEAGGTAPRAADGERLRLLARFRRDCYEKDNEMAVIEGALCSVSERLAVCSETLLVVADSPLPAKSDELVHGVYETLRSCWWDLEEINELRDLALIELTYR